MSEREQERAIHLSTGRHVVIRVPSEHPTALLRLQRQTQALVARSEEGDDDREYRSEVAQLSVRMVCLYSARPKFVDRPADECRPGETSVDDLTVEEFAELCTSVLHLTRGNADPLSVGAATSSLST